MSIRSEFQANVYMAPAKPLWTAPSRVQRPAPRVSMWRRLMALFTP